MPLAGRVRSSPSYLRRNSQMSRFHWKILKKPGGVLIHPDEDKDFDARNQSIALEQTEGGAAGAVVHPALPPTIQTPTNAEVPSKYLTVVRVEPHVRSPSATALEQETKSTDREDNRECFHVGFQGDCSSKADSPKGRGCGSGVVIRCPISGISIDLSESQKSNSFAQNLPAIENVCTIEQQSLKSPQDNGYHYNITPRRRKQGVIERPAIIERRSEDRSKDFKSSGSFASKLNRSFESTGCPFSLKATSENTSKHESIEIHSCLSPQVDCRISVSEATSSSDNNSLSRIFGCPKFKSVGSVSTALSDHRRPDCVSPSSSIPARVTEHTRAADQSCAMYGMLLLSACQFGQAEYGDAMWSKVLEFAGVKNTVFDPHVRYPDHIFTQLAQACTVLIGEGDQDDYMVFFGRCFVRYCSSYGYDKVMRRAGRHFCHFLQEVDNLHAQLRFSFHKMRSPSLIVTRFDSEGAILQYHSCRVGFTHYVIGQLLQIANDFYNLQLQVTVVGEEVQGDINCVSYRLDFDNRDFFQEYQRMKVDFSRPSLPNTTLHVILQLFPCGIVMDSALRVRVAGDRIHQLLGASLIGSNFVDNFSIRRPVMQFSWKEVVMHDRVAWEVVARIKPLKASQPTTPVLPDGSSQPQHSNRSYEAKYSCPSSPSPAPNCFGGFTGTFKPTSTGAKTSGISAICPFSPDISLQNSLRTDSDSCSASLQRRRSHRSDWIHAKRSISADRRSLSADHRSMSGDHRSMSSEHRSMSTENQLQDGEKGLLLKGQMYILKDHQMAMFLCMPLINNQQEMRDLGLYLNDLSMHDLSREMALTDWQHCSTIELMYNRAEENSAKLEETLNLREQWKERGDNLLYAMLPRQVAEVLRQGQHPLDTCQSFEEVSVLFAEASLVDERKSLDALEIVRSVNVMYNLLDDLTDRYSVFKVETVGGVYMVVGGVPEPFADHTAHVAALALHMIRAVADSPRRTHNIRIGIHAGPVVAGVVGNRLPRYCLFGDTVNTASRMLTNCHFGRIHVTERYATAVEAEGFRTRHRGTLSIKGKGQMNTYWLEGYNDDNASRKD